MNINLQSKIQNISLIVCTGLIIASICVPLAVYESLEQQVEKWMQNRRADDLMVSLFQPALIDELRKFETNELYLFAPFEVGLELNINNNNTPNTVYYFTSMRIATLQALPFVEGVSWFRPYISCDFYVKGYKDDFPLTLISQGFLEINGMQIIQGRSPTDSDPPDVAVLGAEVANILFGSPDASIGQKIFPDAISGKECSKELTVIGVLAPTAGSNNPLETEADKNIYIPDREPLDVVDQEKKLHVLPVDFLWVSPKQGYQETVIAEILNYFQQESGDNIYVQITPRKEYYQSIGGIEARLAYLPFIGGVVGMVALVAVLNIGLIIYLRLAQKKYEIGIRRSVGASRTNILSEQLVRISPVLMTSIGAGLILSLVLAPIAGDIFQSHRVGEPFPVSLGTLTAALGVTTGLFLGYFVMIVTVYIFLQNSSARLLVEQNRSLINNYKGKAVGGIGLGAGALTLMILFSLRDGAIAHYDRVLGWVGGEQAGAVVDWVVSFNFSERNADLTSDDYSLLEGIFTNAQFGWLGRKGSLSDIQSIEASASMNTIRPPQMLVGRWINPDEEKNKAYVAVLGSDLAYKLALERDVSVSDLVGQKWRSYVVIGIMDEWPMRRGLGYYSDVAYVPIGTRDEEVYYPGGQIPFIAPQNVDVREFANQVGRELALHHPEGVPQIILAVDKVSDLLNWRLRLYYLLSAFAIVSLLIGSLGIMNLIFMWIVSRWREIGIRRAVGATRGQVARMVLSQSLQITLSAALIGGVLGTVIALIIQQYYGWPLTVYPYWLFIDLGVALLSALIFGGIPAWWAASRTPTEMLRME